MDMQKLKGRLVKISLCRDAYIRYYEGKIELWFNPPSSMSFISMVDTLIGYFKDDYGSEIGLIFFYLTGEQQLAPEINIPKDWIGRINELGTINSVAV